MNRDEMLFWRMVDTYCKPLPRGPMDGAMVYQGKMESILDPRLTVRFLCFSDDLEVLIFVDRVTDPYSDGDDKAPINGWEVGRNYYPWEFFKFKELLSWIELDNKWSNALKRYENFREKGVCNP